MGGENHVFMRNISLISVSIFLKLFPEKSYNYHCPISILLLYLMIASRVVSIPVDSISPATLRQVGL